MFIVLLHRDVRCSVPLQVHMNFYDTEAISIPSFMSRITGGTENRSSKNTTVYSERKTNWKWQFGWNSLQRLIMYQRARSHGNKICYDVRGWWTGRLVARWDSAELALIQFWSTQLCWLITAVTLQIATCFSVVSCLKQVQRDINTFVMSGKCFERWIIWCLRRSKWRRL